MANTIIEEMKVYNCQAYSFKEDYFAIEEGYLGKAKVPNQNLNKDNKSEDLLTKQKKENEELKLDDFVLLRKLRAGNFGQLYACYNRSTQKKYAVKVMNKVKLAK